jgi:peptidyl-prolyl cis-trans isomerase B (cyclophilin B)
MYPVRLMRLLHSRMLSLFVVLLSTLALPLGLVACAAPTAQQTAGCGITPVPCLSGPALVALETSRGEVRIRLDGRDAPLTAGNFVDLVRRGTYNGTIFHRVVREPVPFVVQGGDPQSADPKTPVSQYGTGSFVDPANGESRLIPLELRRSSDRQPRYGSIISSPVESKDLTLTHQRGAVAMARSAAPDSASAQFYIALEALPELDGRYAVFGRVVQGMEVVDKIQQGDKITSARVIEGGLLVKGNPYP